MSTKSPNIISIFNNHFFEFIDDISTVFPDNVKITAAKNALSTIKRANPKMIIKFWIECIVTPYKIQIENGDISFFLNNDYKKDLGDNSQSAMEYIDMLRDPIKNMSPTNQAKTMKYIQNLSKISELL